MTGISGKGLTGLRRSFAFSRGPVLDPRTGGLAGITIGHIVASANGIIHSGTYTGRYGGSPAILEFLKLFTGAEQE